MKKRILIFLACLIPLTSCKLNAQESNHGSPQLTQEVSNEWNCIFSFESFVYQMVEREKTFREDIKLNIYPDSPWQLFTEIPENIPVKYGMDIELTSNHSGKTELWIRADSFNIIRYIVDSNTYSSFSAFPQDNNGDVYKNIVVQDLFEIETGKIIGINYPINYNTDFVEWNETIPLFSIYNEKENTFEFYDIGIKNISGSNYIETLKQIGVIAHNKNLIWIFQQQAGLYSYDTRTGNLKFYETSFEGNIQRILVSQDGFLLFKQEKGVPPTSFWELSSGELVKYYPKSQITEEIDVPELPWAGFGNMLYTKSGDLWIGFHGYLSKNGSWILKNPYRTAYLNLGDSSITYNWNQPDLLFQSSNGYLWYTNEMVDAPGVAGTAWYDPVTEKGCWFTTESGNIVEDSYNNLWMVTGRKIYKYALP